MNSGLVSIVLFICSCSLDGAEAQNAKSVNEGAVIFIACVAGVFILISFALLCMLCIVLGACKRSQCHGKVCPVTPLEEDRVVVVRKSDLLEFGRLNKAKRSVTPKLLSASRDDIHVGLSNIDEVEDALTLQNPSFITEDKQSTHSSSESDSPKPSRCQSKQSAATVITNIGAENESPDEDIIPTTLID